MNMQVHDSLSRSRAAVDADVITIRLESIFEQPFGLFKQCVDGLSLFPGAGEEIAYMTAGDYQHMPGIDRVFVKSDPGQLIFQNHFFWVAEGAYQGVYGRQCTVLQ